MVIRLPEKIEHICQALAANGFQAYIVGGAVRDTLRGVTPDDWDITTDALPNQIEELFDKTIPTGKEFGTITVLIDHEPIEVTTMRKDGRYTDSRHPDEVSFTGDITLDLARRDFTVNAIAYDPIKKRLVDPYRGIWHIKRNKLVCVGQPAQRFQEDPLRMLRLIRFQASLGFRVDKSAATAINPTWIRKISAERIQQELAKLLLSQELVPAMELFYSSGLMKEILPELAAEAGVSQGTNHRYDVLGHSIVTAQSIKPQLDLRWAALLHDVGKPLTRSEDEGEIHFYNHDQVGADMAVKILKRLRCSNLLIEKVKVLIAHHMYRIHPHSTDKALRRFISKVGTEHIFDLIELRQADIAGMYFNAKQAVEYVQAMRSRIEDVLAESSALTVRDLAVNGTDVIQHFRLNPGPIVGEILNYLLDAVVDDPKVNTRQSLLHLAEEYMKGLPL